MELKSTASGSWFEGGMTDNVDILAFFFIVESRVGELKLLF